MVDKLMYTLNYDNKITHFVVRNFIICIKDKKTPSLYTPSIERKMHHNDRILKKMISARGKSQGGRRHWAVYYPSPQSFKETFYY